MGDTIIYVQFAQISQKITFTFLTLVQGGYRLADAFGMILECWRWVASFFFAKKERILLRTTDRHS